MFPFSDSAPVNAVKTLNRRKAIKFFPTPSQVAGTDVDVLRTAGLSARKAEYSEYGSFFRGW